MSRKYIQIYPNQALPLAYRPVAGIRLTPRDFYDLHGVSFHLARDDLDYLLAANLKTESGEEFLLLKYDSEDDTTLNVVRSDEESVDTQIKRILMIFDLDDSDLTWKNGNWLT